MQPKPMFAVRKMLGTSWECVGTFEHADSVREGRLVKYCVYCAASPKGPYARGAGLCIYGLYVSEYTSHCCLYVCVYKRVVVRMRKY
jgi:hypothetical protein